MTTKETVCLFLQRRAMARDDLAFKIVIGLLVFLIIELVFASLGEMLC
jgi:hypothetical protein